MVYGLSKDGSEDSILHILTVADGKDLPEQIPNTEAAHPQWLDDGSGFFYNQLTGKVDTPERYLDSQARFHRLGTDPAGDPILMKRGLDARVQFESIQMPVIATFEGSHYALLLLQDVRSEMRILIAPLADVVAGKAHWMAVADFDDEVTERRDRRRDALPARQQGSSARPCAQDAGAALRPSRPPPRSCRRASGSSRTCTWRATGCTCG